MDFGSRSLLHRTEAASSGFLRLATAVPPPLVGTMPSPPLRAGGCGMPSPPVLSLFKYACEAQSERCHSKQSPKEGSSLAVRETRTTWLQVGTAAAAARQV